MTSLASFSLANWLLTYLLNALWQIPLVFAAAWLAARALRRLGPPAEHRVWVSALALELLLPACSFHPAEILHALVQLWPRHATTASAHITIAIGPATASTGLHLPPALLTTVLAAYACIILYFAARLVWRLHQTTQLRREALPLVLAGAAARYWTRCCEHFAVYNAAIATSPTITFPMTLGIRRRILLLPANLPATLRDEDLNAAIAHEFAHMRRHDFALNLLYAALALPIAWHPFFWVTRIRLEESREMLCDALAASSLVNPRTYAPSLLRLAMLFLQTPPARTAQALGIFDTRIFERRIMNLTQRPRSVSRFSRLALTGACIVLGLGTCTSALALRLNVAAPSFTVTGNQDAAPTGPAIKVTGGVIAGSRLSFVPPIYPAEAKAKKISGTVVLRARIGKDGQIASLQVVSGPPELTKSAWEAVKQWTYKPYLLNGDPVEVDTTITVNYSLAPADAPESSPPPPAATAQTQPILLSAPPPEYPAKARADKNMLNGTVGVSFTVEKDGLPSHVAISKSLRPDFDQSALAAVRQYRFTPALADGSPVQTNLTVEVNFQQF
jgi:TonB family protein